MFKVTSYNTYSMEVAGTIISNVLLGVGAVFGFILGETLIGIFFSIAFAFNMCWDLTYLIGTRKNLPVWASSALVIKFLLFIAAYTVVAIISGEFDRTEIEWFLAIYFGVTALPFGFMMAHPIICAHRKMYLEKQNSEGSNSQSELKEKGSY